MPSLAGGFDGRQSPLMHASCSPLEAHAPIFGLAALKAAPFAPPANSPPDRLPRAASAVLPDPVKVWYVFSQFPTPSETFAGTDVRVLRGLGVQVRAVNLRPSHPRALQLLREWGLEGLEVDAVTPGKLLAGMGQMLCRPRLLARLLGIILRDNGRQPVQVAKSLLALPRVFQLQRALAADPPEVLHLFWGHYAALLGLVVRWTQPRVAVTVFLGAYDLRTRYATSATLARQAHAVFTHARANVPLLARQGIPAEKVTVVWRGVDFARLQAPGVVRQPRRIATAGRLTREKGMVEVVETFARVQATWPEASLVIVGDGPQRASLERRVRERGLRRVEFTGHLPHAEVFRRLAGAEVFLFLSHEEHLPNALKEAMAAGCACVVSRTAGIEELVIPGEGGLIVEPGDLAGAAAAVDRLFRAPDLRERLARRARAHLEAHFDARRNLARYVEVWEQCRAGRDRGRSAVQPVRRKE